MVYVIKYCIDTATYLGNDEECLNCTEYGIALQLEINYGTENSYFCYVMLWRPGTDNRAFKDFHYRIFNTQHSIVCRISGQDGY